MFTEKFTIQYCNISANGFGFVWKWGYPLSFLRLVTLNQIHVQACLNLAITTPVRSQKMSLCCLYSKLWTHSTYQYIVQHRHAPQLCRLVQPLFPVFYHVSHTSNVTNKKLATLFMTLIEYLTSQIGALQVAISKNSKQNLNQKRFQKYQLPKFWIMVLTGLFNFCRFFQRWFFCFEGLQI